MIQVTFLDLERKSPSEILACMTDGPSSLFVLEARGSFFFFLLR